MTNAKRVARVEALESKATPTELRNIHLIVKGRGQTTAEAIAASGFDPNDDFIMLVGMRPGDVEREDGRGPPAV